MKIVLKKPVVIRDMEKAIKGYNAFFKDVERRFIDRAQEVTQIKYALLMKEHVLLKGRPGTAKSQMARTIFTNIENSKLFEIQLSKFMSEDYLFGPVNVKKLREDGEIIHNTKNTVVDSHFAFIDEFFDGSDVLIRSLLEIFNERTFTRNTQKEKCNLHTAILTSNYSREEEATEAILDRILFKSDVQPIATPAGRMKLYRNALDVKSNGTQPLKGKLRLEDIEALARFAKNRVTIDDEVLEMFDGIIKEYFRESQQYISDRTKVKMLFLMKVNAMLEGRVTVMLDDIECIRYTIGTGGDNDDRHKQAFVAICHKYVADSRKEQEEIVMFKQFQDRYDVIMASKPKNSRPDLDALVRIKEINKLSKEMSEVDQSKLVSDQVRKQFNTLYPQFEQKVQELRRIVEG